MIRRANKRDVPEIVRIEQSSFSDPWDKKLFLDALDSKEKYLYAHVSGSALSGYIIFEKVLDEGHITNLAVAKEYQGKGIASELVSAVMDLAASLGVKGIFLEVRQGNEAAKKLYSKFGFKEIGKRKGYYPKASEDALVLKRDLV